MKTVLVLSNTYTVGTIAPLRGCAPLAPVLSLKCIETKSINEFSYKDTKETNN